MHTDRCKRGGAARACSAHMTSLVSGSHGAHSLPFSKYPSAQALQYGPAHTRAHTRAVRPNFSASERRLGVLPAYWSAQPLAPTARTKGGASVILPPRQRSEGGLHGRTHGEPCAAPG